MPMEKNGLAAFSSSTRGVVGGGAIYANSAYTLIDTIEYVTIASTGNAQDFGDLTGVNNYLSGTSNSVRGIFNQGTSPTYLNTIQYVTIASTGDAQDFGDLSMIFSLITMLVQTPMVVSHKYGRGIKI